MSGGWPELLGAVAMLLVLAVVRRRRRHLIGQRISGKRYGKRCNYCLEGWPGSRCPDCGHDFAGHLPLTGPCTTPAL